MLVLDGTVGFGFWGLIQEGLFHLHVFKNYRVTIEVKLYKQKRYLNEKFQSVDGTITMINDFVTGSNEEIGCNKLMSVYNGYGNLINFVVKPNTYFIDYATVVVGDKVTGFTMLTLLLLSFSHHNFKQLLL